MTTFSQPPGTPATPTSRRQAHRCARHHGRHADPLPQIGVEITASRLRLLGHPTRLRIIRSLDERSRTMLELSEQLSLPEATVGAHVRLLCRAGVVMRVERSGPAAFRLLDWPSLWLIEQFARRLSEQARSLVHTDKDSDCAGEGSSCR